MADSKISALTAHTAPISTDVIPIVDVTAGSTKKITLANLTNNSGINLLENSNFINNSTNGYGTTPDDWISSSANPVQGGFPAMTKQNLIDLLGVADGDIEGLWNLNEASGNATDLSSNGYTLTDTNTVTSSSDGLMASNRFFTVANSECFTIADASCANLEIAGSKTYFAWVKPSAIGINQTIMSKSKSDNTIRNMLVYVNTSNTVTVICEGLTTNTTVTSDVILEANKWYFIAARYDSVGTTLSVWVNGIKKSVTASGSGTDTNGPFEIGRANSGAGLYWGGIIANVGVLSVALTDLQLKRLFAATTYRGQKIRRATTNASLTATLTEDKVERLRGKTITILAQMWQDTASTGQISITGATETASSTTATTGSWVSVSATHTVAATATSITLSLKHSTSDGNTWFKDVMLNAGSTALPWTAAPEDWARFPRLLRMDIPSFVGLRPYQYEENRMYTWTPTFTFTAGAAPTTPGTSIARASFSGKTCISNISTIWGVAGTTVTIIHATAPIKIGSNNSGYFITPAVVANAFAPVVAFQQNTNAELLLDVYCSSSTIDRYGINSTYEID